MLFGDDSASRVERVAARLLYGLAEAVWPTRGVWCGEPGTHLCPECARNLGWVDQRYACPLCGAPYGHITCTACKREWLAPVTVCATGFGDASARMVTTLKDAHETRLAPVMAAAMACALDEASAWADACDGVDGPTPSRPAAPDAIAFVPATAAAYARRGFDHMELVARALSRYLGVGVADVLVRGPSRDQRELSRSDREKNLASSVRVVDDVAGASLLLVDDVVTTGASLAACSRALLSAGARDVSACGFARVW